MKRSWSPPARGLALDVDGLEDLLERDRFPLPIFEYLPLKEIGRLASVSRRVCEASAGALSALKKLTIGPYARGAADPRDNDIDAFRRSQSLATRIISAMPLVRLRELELHCLMRDPRSRWPAVCARMTGLTSITATVASAHPAAVEAMLASRATLTHVSLLDDLEAPTDSLSLRSVAEGLQQALSRCCRLTDLTLSASALAYGSATAVALFPSASHLRRLCIHVGCIGFPDVDNWGDVDFGTEIVDSLIAAVRLVSSAPASLFELVVTLPDDECWFEDDDGDWGDRIDDSVKQLEAAVVSTAMRLPLRRLIVRNLYTRSDLHADMLPTELLAVEELTFSSSPPMVDMDDAYVGVLRALLHQAGNLRMLDLSQLAPSRIASVEAGTPWDSPLTVAEGLALEHLAVADLDMLVELRRTGFLRSARPSKVTLRTATMWGGDDDAEVDAARADLVESLFVHVATLQIGTRGLDDAVLTSRCLSCCALFPSIHTLVLLHEPAFRGDAASRETLRHSLAVAVNLNKGGLHEIIGVELQGSPSAWCAPQAEVVGPNW